MPSVPEELTPGEQGHSWPTEERGRGGASSSGNSWYVCHQQSPSSFDVKDSLLKHSVKSFKKHGNKVLFF